MSYTDNLADELFLICKLNFQMMKKAAAFRNRYSSKKSKVQLERFETKEDIHLDTRTE